MRRFRRWLVNWLFSDITVKLLRTNGIYIQGGSTAYINYLDLNHQGSDPGSPTESLVWYNSSDHVLRYYNGSETVDC